MPLGAAPFRKPATQTHCRSRSTSRQTSELGLARTPEPVLSCIRSKLMARCLAAAYPSSRRRTASAGIRLPSTSPSSRHRFWISSLVMCAVWSSSWSTSHNSTHGFEKATWMPLSRASWNACGMCRCSSRSNTHQISSNRSSRRRPTLRFACSRARCTRVKGTSPLSPRSSTTFQPAIASRYPGSVTSPSVKTRTTLRCGAKPTGCLARRRLRFLTVTFRLAVAATHPRTPQDSAAGCRHSDRGGNAV